MRRNIRDLLISFYEENRFFRRDGKRKLYCEYEYQLI